jgi:hypothetical protein
MPYDFLQMLPTFVAATMILVSSLLSVWLLPWTDVEIKRCMEELSGFRKAISWRKIAVVRSLGRISPAFGSIPGKRHG